MSEQVTATAPPGPSEDSAGVPQGAHAPEAGLRLPLERPAAVLALHEQLAPVAWAFARALPEARLGFVQTAGDAEALARWGIVRELRGRGLLAGHLTAGTTRGGADDGNGTPLTTAAALHRGLRELGWDAAVCGPGPASAGAQASLGHGAMGALDCAHTAIALGARTLLVARMSSAQDGAGRRGIAESALTVLDLLLEPVTVALPAGIRSPVGADLRARLGSVFGAGGAEQGGLQLALDVDRPTGRGPAGIARHDWRRAPIDMPAYLASGLSAGTEEALVRDPLFFAAALASGTVLAELCGHTQESAGRA